MTWMEKIKSAPRAVKIAIIAGVLVLLLAGGLLAARQIWLKKDALHKYETVLVDYGEVSRSISETGKLEFDTTVFVFTQSAQTVSRIHVKEGDRVSEGELLVEYDLVQDESELSRRLEEAKLYLKNAQLNLQAIAQPAQGNQLLQYQAQVLSAQKSVSDTQGEIESLESKVWQQELRVRNLKEIAEEYESDPARTALEYETAYTNYRVARAGLSDLRTQLETQEKTLEFQEKQLAQAQKKLENAQLPLDDSANKIKYAVQQNIVRINELAVGQLEDDLAKLTDQTLSPVTGYVSAVHIVEGESTSKGYAVLELIRQGTPVASLDISEYDAPLLEEGQPARLSIAALSDEEFDGVVEKIHSHAIEKDSSGSDEMVVPVKIVLLNADERLKAGYTADVRIILEERTEVLAIPLKALVTRDGVSYVYLLREKRVVRQEVETGMYGDKMVEIIEGISPGDVLILNHQAA